MATKDTKAVTKDNSEEVKYYKSTKINDSQYEFEIEIPADVFAEGYEVVLNQKLKDVNIKGFRKGNAPRDMLELGLKAEVLQETFERLAYIYINGALNQEKIAPIAPIDYKKVEELDKGKVAKFTITVSVMPDFKLGDMSKINVKIDSPEPTEEEIQNTLETMFKNNVTVFPEHKEANDAWAKDLAKKYSFEGGETLADIKKMIAESISSQKVMIVEQNATSEAVRKAVELSQIVIPEAAIEFEAKQREDAFLKDLKEIGTPLEDFEKRNGVKVDDLRAKWREDGREALENDVFLRLYADHIKAEVEEKEIDLEAEKVKMQFESRKQEYNKEFATDPNWRANIRTFLLKQKALQQFINETLPALKESRNDALSNAKKAVASKKEGSSKKAAPAKKKSSETKAKKEETKA